MIGVHTGGFPPARDTESGRGGRRAARASSTPSSSTSGSRSGTSTATRAGPRATSGTAQGALLLDALRRGRLPGDRARDPGAARRGARRSCAPVRPEDEEGVLLPAQTADQPGRLLRPVRGRRRVGRARGRRARCVANGRALRASTAPGCYALVEHPHHTAGVLDAGGRPGRDLPRHLLHARAVAARAASRARSPSRRMSRGGPSSSTTTARARPVGRGVRLGGEEVRLVDPGARVERAASPPASPLRRVVAAATGRSGGCGRRARAARATPSRRSTSRIPRRPPRRSALRRRGRGRPGPSPSALSAATAPT